MNRDSKDTLASLGEDGLLEVLRPILSRHTEGLPLPTGDDVAITVAAETSRARLVWTIDAMVEGTHFRLRGDSRDAEWVGRKLAASNLSDLASKGAVPLYALLSFGAPGTATRTEIEAFYRGLDEQLTSAGARLIGGDTVRAPQWTLSLTVIGRLDETAGIAARSISAPGHAVYITGFPGRSGAGLAALEAGAAEKWPGLVRAHSCPQPRLLEGRALVTSIRDLAMLDVSDGVARDIGRIAQASGVKIVLEEARFGYNDELMHFASQTGRSARDFYLFGGEDYELAFTTAAPEEDISRILRDVGSNLPITRIGRVEEGAGLYLESTDGAVELLKISGFEHFA